MKTKEFRFNLVIHGQKKKSTHSIDDAQSEHDARRRVINYYLEQGLFLKKIKLIPPTMA